MSMLHGRRKYKLLRYLSNGEISFQLLHNFMLIMDAACAGAVAAVAALQTRTSRDTHALTHTQLFDFVVCGSVGGEVLIGRGSSEASNPQTTTATMSMMSTVLRQKL